MYKKQEFCVQCAININPQVDNVYSCDKVSCGSCINDYSYVDCDHIVSSIILYLIDVEYKLVH